MPPKHIQLRDADLEPDRPTVGIGANIYRLRLPIDLPPAQLSAIHRLSNAIAEETDPAEQYRMLLALVPAILFDPIDNDTLASLSPDEGVRAINFFTSHWREVHRIEMARAQVKAAYLGMRLIGSRPIARLMARYPGCRRCNGGRKTRYVV